LNSSVNNVQIITLAPWSKVLPRKLIIAKLTRKLSALNAPEIDSSYSKDPAVGPSWGNSVCFFRRCPLNSYFSLHLCLGFPDGLFHTGFVTTFSNFRLPSSLIRTLLIIFQFLELCCKVQAAAVTLCYYLHLPTVSCLNSSSLKKYIRNVQENPFM